MGTTRQTRESWTAVMGRGCRDDVPLWSTASRETVVRAGGVHASQHGGLAGTDHVWSTLPAGNTVPDGAIVNLLELLVGSVVDYAIFVLDVDGRISSPGTPARSGSRATAPDEMIGRHFSIFYSGMTTVEDGFPERELAIAAAAGRFEDEGWRVRKDGTRFWANVVITALRERRRPAGRASARSRATSPSGSGRKTRCGRARSASGCWSSGVSDYAIFLLDPDGTSVELEPRRRAPQGLPGRRDHRPALLDLLHRRRTSGRGCRERGLREATAKGRWENEGWRVRKDGSRFWADVVITALRGADGQLRGFAKVTRDLTERKQGEDALRGDPRARASGR